MPKQTLSQRVAGMLAWGKNTPVDPPKRMPRAPAQSAQGQIDIAALSRSVQAATEAREKMHDERRRMRVAGLTHPADAPGLIMAAADPAFASAHFGPPMTKSEPFDAPYVLTRNGGATEYNTYHLTGVIAGISEEHAKWSCPAPFFWELHGTDHPQANRGELTAMASAIYLNTHNYGNGWLTGYHIDSFHHGPDGTTIGYNMEAKRLAAGGTQIGFNAHNDGNSVAQGDIAYFINGEGATGWRKGVVRSHPGAMMTVGDKDYLAVRDDHASIWGSHHDPVTSEHIGSFACDEDGNMYIGAYEGKHRTFEVIGNRVFLHGKELK